MNNGANINLVLGTAGHIDHGKSSLVKALTGIDPDRLAEEKKRGITIELGFAQLELPDGNFIGLVDVPGHERFVRQMIAGATGIDFAMLCIAADDGIMPQTLEHVAVLQLLGINRLVVALTKSDLVDQEWLDLITLEIQKFLETTSFAGAAIVPVSSITGRGITELKDEIYNLAQSTARGKLGNSARLPIDRSFTIKGSGTVITGTLWSGKVCTDDDLEVLPGSMRVRVRSVQVHGEEVDYAQEGNRVALNLSAVKLSEIHPGDFLVAPASVESSDRFDAFFTYMDTSKSGKPLRSGSRVHVAHGTREVIGRILFMNDKKLLKPGESAFAQLRTEEALPVVWQDHFIVRSYSPVHVIGGGTILLSHPRHRTILSELELELLEALREGDDQKACLLALSLQSLPVSTTELAEVVGLNQALVEANLDAMVAKSDVIKIGETEDLYTSRSLLQKAVAGIENALLKFHAQNPISTGISKAALQKICFPRASSACFDALLFETQREKKAVLDEGEVSHPQAGGGARKVEQQAAENLLEVLERAGEEPPTIEGMISDSKLESSLVYRAIGVLEKQGKVKRINNELCFSTDALERLYQKVCAHLRVSDGATVAELKDAMNTSRKYAVPLLEYFDAQGITVREGDKRSLRTK